jgi:hypothetical protein
MTLKPLRYLRGLCVSAVSAGRFMLKNEETLLPFSPFALFTVNIGDS